MAAAASTGAVIRHVFFGFCERNALPVGSCDLERREFIGIDRRQRCGRFVFGCRVALLNRP